MSEAGGQLRGFKPLPLDVDTIKLKDHERYNIGFNFKGGRMAH